MFTARRYLALLPLALPRRDTSIGRYLNLSLSSSLCISPVLILLLFPFLFYQRSSTSSPPPPPPPQEENLEREELEEDALPVFLSCYLRRGIKPGQGGSSPLLSLSRLNHRTSEQSYSDDDRRSGSSVGKFFSRASVHPLAARSYRNSSIGAEGRQERRRVGREEGEKIRGRELRRKTVDYVCLTTPLPLTSERPGVMFEHEK